MSSLNFIRKPFSLALFLAALLSVSCQNNDTKEAAVESQERTEMTLEQKKQQLNAVSPSASPAANTGNVALNPPHGQPGHRCEIPVGAPLDGSGNTGGNRAAAPAAAPIAPASSSPNASPKINPPHGQPGHRCDVRVGDPLP